MRFGWDQRKKNKQTKKSESYWKEFNKLGMLVQMRLRADELKKMKRCLTTLFDNLVVEASEELRLDELGKLVATMQRRMMARHELIQVLEVTKSFPHDHLFNRLVQIFGQKLKNKNKTKK